MAGTRMTSPGLALHKCMTSLTMGPEGMLGMAGPATETTILALLRLHTLDDGSTAGHPGGRNIGFMEGMAARASAGISGMARDTSSPNWSLWQLGIPLARGVQERDLLGGEIDDRIEPHGGGEPFAALRRSTVSCGMTRAICAGKAEFVLNSIL